jgi:hypothetical protein
MLFETFLSKLGFFCVLGLFDELCLLFIHLALLSGFSHFMTKTPQNKGYIFR